MADSAAVQLATAVPLRDWLIVAPLVIPILAGALLVALRGAIRIQAGIAVLALALMAAADAALLGRVLAEGPAAMTMGRWLPPFGISFAVDALGAGFALVGALVALVCAIYAAWDAGATGVRYGFYPFLLLMMAGVSGAFLTGDIFNLYVWFEVFVIASFGLLVLGSTRAQLDGALKYAVLNLIGTTLFLVATGYLYGIFGTLNMADIAIHAPALRTTAPLATLATLYLAAFGMKAAAFPLNFWLPASYHTPGTASSALFAGLLTKVGIYALLRTLVLIFPVERALLSGAIGWVAGLTMLLGALGALAQSDIRRLFGFVILSGIGVMLAGLSLGTPEALAGTIVYAIVSMVGMSALYLLAGTVRAMTGTTSLHELGGLFRRAPLFSAIAIALFLSATGLPPLAGLWPKVMLVRAAVDAGAGWLASAILVSSFLLMIALFRIFLLAFWRETEPAATEAPASPVNMACLAVLAAGLLGFGIAPEPVVRYAITAAAGLAEPAAYLHAVFPGVGAVNFVVAIILMTIAWMALGGSWTLANLALGAVLSAATLFLVRGELGRRPVTVRPWKLLLLSGLFLRELVLSAWRVAVLVLSPRMDLKPGIFAFPLTVDRDFEITLLANLITLTPGTLSVDVSEDRGKLYVHALDSSDPGKARADIAAGFERRILEAFR